MVNNMETAWKHFGNKMETIWKHFGTSVLGLVLVLGLGLERPIE